MYFAALGPLIRRARKEAGLTQAGLARQAGVARTTLNQLENGVFPDIGVKKLMAILAIVGQGLAVVPAASGRGEPDYLRMACTSASTSFRDALRPDELVHALLTGKVPPGKRPHFRVILEELPTPVLEGVVRQVGAWSSRERVLENLRRIADVVGAGPRVAPWMTPA
jgi:transcriptional regulator with XRE-family HTH domain